LTHLLFIDDVLLLYNGSRRDASKLEDILLELYCKAIGMMVNMEKIKITFNVVEEQIQSIPHLKLPIWFQLLGVLYHKPNDSGVKQWKWFISIVERRINLWRNRWLFMDTLFCLNQCKKQSQSIDTP